MVEGWPRDKGPLHTLTMLGNLPADTEPQWLNRATTENTPGATTYQAATQRGLTAPDLVSLAALVLEGYDVRTYPRGRWTHIVITERTTE